MARSSTRVAAGTTRNGSAAVRSATTALRPSAQRNAAASHFPGSRGIDWRWALAGGLALLVLAVLALNMLKGPGGGAATGTSTGEVTERVAGSAAPAMLPVGTEAPDLQWTLGGTPSSLRAMRGQPVLLVFFATWCPHCQAEAPVISRVAERYGSSGLKVVGVSASPVGQDQRSPASVADVQSFAQKFGARYPQLFDAALVGAQRFGVRSYPTIYLVDKDGVIQFAQSGEVPEATLASAVEQATR